MKVLCSFLLLLTCSRSLLYTLTITSSQYAGNRWLMQSSGMRNFSLLPYSWYNYINQLSPCHLNTLRKLADSGKKTIWTNYKMVVRIQDVTWNMITWWCFLQRSSIFFLKRKCTLLELHINRENSNAIMTKVGHLKSPPNHQLIKIKY